MYENAVRASRDKALIRLAGTVLRPGAEGYDDARRPWNAAVDRRPAAAVALSVTAEEVAAAVDYAREEELPLAIFDGGHSVAGHSVVDGGGDDPALADDDVEVDRAARVVHLGGGARCSAISTARRKSTGSSSRPAPSPTRASAA